MTKVRFTFVDIQGNPLPLMEFKLIVRRASFNIEDVGVTLPEELNVTTDVTGQVIVELWPLKTAYRIQVAEEYEELCGKLNWSFYVPHTTEIVEAQTLFLVPPPNNLPWDEEAMGKITQAVIDSKDSAEASEASAVRAENAAQSIEGDADRAEAARDAAEASKNAAAGSAQSAANSAAASGQSATDALASKNAAANSANAANNSAVSASNDAGRAAASEAAALASKNAAAGSATAASTSATTATNAANSATASKDAAAASATTASTKAGEASTSAGNALTQANRAKTEADRAVAATDGKQDKDTLLTNLSSAVWKANTYPVIAGDKSVFVETISDEARILLRQPTIPGMQSRLGLVPVTNSLDITPGRLVTPGWMGLGRVYSNALPNSDAQVAVPAGIYYVPATWAGSPFPGTDGRNQGYLTVKGWSSSDYMAQTWEPLRRGDAPMMHRYSYNGVWQAWQSILSGTVNQSESIDQKLVMRNIVGIGTPHTYCIDIDARSAPSLVLGYSYCTTTTLGTKPGGYSYGVVNTVVNAGDHLQQEFVGLNAVPGATQRAYRRSGYNTAWGPWRLVIDSASATEDVESGGGVVSRTIISGCVVNKFASGLIVLNGNFGTTPTIEPNAYTIVNLTLPVSTGPDISYASVVCIASPYVTNDWYGITNCYMDNPTLLKVVIRNGATAQAFGVRGIVTGHWK